MKKLTLTAIIAAFIALFSTQASACGENGSCNGNCNMRGGEHSCSCKNGSCTNGK